MAWRITRAKKLRRGLPLQQIVLGAIADRFNAQLLIVETGQDNDRNMPRRAAGPRERLEPGAVGQPKIQQYRVDVARFLEKRFGFGHALDAVDVDGLFLAGQHFDQKIGVPHIVLDKESAEPTVAHGSPPCSGRRGAT